MCLVQLRCYKMRVAFVLWVLILYCKCNIVMQHPTSSSTIAQQDRTKEITIPIMFHFDIKLTKKLAKEYSFRTRRKIKTITKNVLQKASAIFKHSSLNRTINFELLDTKFIKNNTAVRLDENASIYLKNYCDWQNQKKIFKKRMYYSVMLTGLNLFYVNNGRNIRGSVGRSYTSGACSKEKSCALIEWVPANMGYLLAHEIAHSLGVSHDGPPFNKCHNRKFIMTPRHSSSKPPVTWSHCSRIQMDNFLRGQRSWCVRR